MLFFSSKPYDEKHLSEIQQSRHESTYFDTQLNANTAKLAEGFDAVCCFVNDSLDRAAFQGLKDHHIHRVVSCYVVPDLIILTFPQQKYWALR